jgi:hypothetical protein
MLLALTLAVSALGQDSEWPARQALPTSLAAGALAACAPATLEAAEQCLRTSLSADDLAILQDRIPARRFRPSLDCEIVAAWKLADPSSPMARVMDGLVGFHRPQFEAGMIISDLQVRANNHNDHGMAFDQVREAMQQSPPEPDSSTCQSIQAQARPS